MSTQQTPIDIDKLEQLTNARKEAWRALHETIGADNAAQTFAKRCREAMNAAANASERADTALFEFIRSQTDDGA